MRPQTKFVKNDDITIAYQVSGNESVDLVYVSGWLSNVEDAWEHPPYANFLTKLESFSRLIRMDKRGSGLSDRISGVPTLEQCMNDLRAVMDDVGSERAFIYGTSAGGFLSMMFAANCPERTAGLILCNCFGDFRAPDYPWRRSREEWEGWLNDLKDNPDDMCDQTEGELSVVSDVRTRELIANYVRYSMSPEAANEFSQFMFEIDDHNTLRTIQVPTLVLHSQGDRWSSIRNGRYLVEQIPNAVLVELPGGTHIDWAGNQDRVIDEIKEFVTGVSRGPPMERVLVTVMITDIVESTATAAEMGDESWRHLHDQHDALIEREVHLYCGRVVESTGDGLIAIFNSPTRAIHCAAAAEQKVRLLGVRIRIGIHTGECEQHGDVLSGMTLHIATRVTELAQPDTVWTSRTVKDVVVGSGIEFVAKGQKDLKGVPGKWELFSVDSHSIATLR